MSLSYRTREQQDRPGRSVIALIRVDAAERHSDLHELPGLFGTSSLRHVLQCSAR